MIRHKNIAQLQIELCGHCGHRKDEHFDGRCRGGPFGQRCPCAARHEAWQKELDDAIVRSAKS